MSLKIEDFDPVSNSELREFWVAYPDKNVRRLILEIVRHRRVMGRARGEAQQIEPGLRAKNAGQVVGAAQLLLNRLLEEGIRLGSQGGIMIKLETDVQYRRTEALSLLRDRCPQGVSYVSDFRTVSSATHYAAT